MTNLRCPHCKDAHDLRIIFANCKVCVPDTKSFSFFCPQCGEHSEIRVENEEVLIGLPDGFPEPMFVEEGRVRASGISVRWNRFESDVTYDDHHWSYGVTDYYRQIHGP